MTVACCDITNRPKFRIDKSKFGFTAYIINQPGCCKVFSRKISKDFKKALLVKRNQLQDKNELSYEYCSQHFLRRSS